MVVIEMENGGKIEIELYPETAPITVKNFEKLVKEGKVTVTQKGNKLYAEKSTAWKNIERITKTYLGATPNVKWMP